MFLVKNKFLCNFSLFTVLVLNAYSLGAQNTPNFEQTVAYLKENTMDHVVFKGPLDDFQRAKGHKLNAIIIDENGDVRFKIYHNRGIQDFDIAFNVFDLEHSADYPDGVKVKGFLIHFKGLNVSGGFGIYFGTEKRAVEVARAFRNLKSVCNKEGDLSTKPVKVEEKVSLSKEETIAYIRDLLDEIDQDRGEAYAGKTFEKDPELNRSQGRREIISHGFSHFIIDSKFQTEEMYSEKYEYSHDEAKGSGAHRETSIGYMLEKETCQLDLKENPVEKVTWRKKYALGKHQTQRGRIPLDRSIYSFQVHLKHPFKVMCKKKYVYIKNLDHQKQVSLSDAVRKINSSDWTDGPEYRRTSIMVWIDKNEKSEKLYKAFLHLKHLSDEEAKAEAEKVSSGK